MGRFKYAVSFRIEHPGMEPQEISLRLSLTPDQSWKAGDVRKSSKGTPLKGRYKNTFWRHSVKHTPDMSLVDCLKEFTSNLESNIEFLKEIRYTGGRCEYFIGWFSGHNSGEMLDFELLNKLGNLKIDLSLDVYGV